MHNKDSVVYIFLSGGRGLADTVIAEHGDPTIFFAFFFTFFVCNKLIQNTIIN